MNQQEIEAKLIEKANTDADFRQLLLADPKTAIADLLGITLPPGMHITVLEERPGHHFFVLPPAPVDALPLDDLELALVGGGRTLRPIVVKCGVRNTSAAALEAKANNRTSC